MTEEVLQHIWQYQIFNNTYNNVFKTVDGKILKVIKIGSKNVNQGPDFSESKILINDIEWNGNVEIHLKSSLWNVHNHQDDPNYDNVILHVVLVDDKPIKRKNGELIPCIEIDSVIDSDFTSNYDDLIKSECLFPCEKSIQNVREISKRTMLERVLIERLERKSELFNTWLVQNNNDWEQTAFEVVSYCLGLKINAEVFRNLAHSLSYKTIFKHQDNPFQIESLLFGNAGFLDEELDDEHFCNLKKEYNFLKIKYKLDIVLKKQNWNFHRLRPAAFPTVRIAQLTSFLSDNDFLFSKILELNPKEIKFLFEHKLKGYWNESYDFGKESKTKNNGIGESTKDLILINGVVPLLYLYFKKTNQTEYLNKCFNILELVKKESNSKISNLNNYFEIKSAYDSQSVLELFDYYCKNKKCLNCTIMNDVT